MEEPEYKDMTGKPLTNQGLEYVKYHDGSEVWYKDGKRHRESGPAFKVPSGREVWYKGGKQHRLDGPAKRYFDGSVAYWIEDIKISKEDFDHAWTCPMKELPLLINKDTAPIAKWRFTINK